MTSNSRLGRALTDAVTIDQGILRNVLDQSRDCVKILGPLGHIEYINSEGRCALAISDLSEVLGRVWADLWPEQSRPVVREALKKAQTGESSEIEAWRPDPHGEPRWWRVSVSPLLEDNEELAGILTNSRDVSEHVQLRESEKTLALEMRHRLRNAYTIASAIVMQSAQGDGTNKAFAESVCGRLADVALSQTRLLDAGQKSWMLGDLVNTLVAAHGESAMRIDQSGDEDVTIDGHEAMLVALVMGELANNSIKYGALRRGRTVSLSWLQDGSSLAINWHEPLDGKQITSMAPRDPASGYWMMQRMARSQRAKFEHAVVDGALEVTLTLARRDRS